MRASVAAEKAGIPATAVITTGFLAQARAVAQAQGFGNLSIAEYPGVIMMDSQDELRQKVEETLVTSITQGLATVKEKAARPAEPEPKAMVFRGTMEEVNEFFIKNLWSDGLPIIPPTTSKVEQFLKFTDRSPDEIIGSLLPENREATVWNVAVNGVMAGCRPEYMPILLAAVEAIADPEFRIQDAGSTPGWEPLIILNGPIIKELDFNSGSGVMKVGRQSNTSVGRFLRLYMRNVAGLRIPPGATDKASIGFTFNAVLAEDEDFVAELGWEPFSVDRGFKRGENIVTVQSVVAVSPPAYTGGDNPYDHLETLTEIIGRRTAACWMVTATHWGKFNPFILLSPSVAKIMARGKVTKNDIRQYLYENAKVQAGLLERLGWQIGLSDFSLCRAVEEGTAPKEFCESTDPDRMVPVFLKPEWIGIVVSGDPGRNHNRGYIPNHEQGAPTSRKIELPANWEQLLKETKK